MNRRTYLISLGSAVAIGSVGCINTDIDLDDSGTTDGADAMDDETTDHSSDEQIGENETTGGTYTMQQLGVDPWWSRSAATATDSRVMLFAGEEAVTAFLDEDRIPYDGVESLISGTDFDSQRLLFIGCGANREEYKAIAIEALDLDGKKITVTAAAAANGLPETESVTAPSVLVRCTFDEAPADAVEAVIEVGDGTATVGGGPAHQHEESALTEPTDFHRPSIDEALSVEILAEYHPGLGAETTLGDAVLATTAEEADEAFDFDLRRDDAVAEQQQALLEETEFDESVVLFVTGRGPQTCYAVKIHQVALSDERLEIAASTARTAPPGQPCGDAISHPTAMLRITGDEIPSAAQVKMVDGWGNERELTVVRPRPIND